MVKKTIPGILVIILLIAILSTPLAGEAKETNRLFVIPVHGDIVPSLESFIRRHVSKAIDEGASVLVFDIDTFGGRVDTALQISSFIGSIKKAKTVAFIRSGPASMGVSWSAGALIALSCGEIYMAPGTSIGAAAPVTIGADGSMQPAGEKVVSAVRTQMAALAEKNGHPVKLALAMVDLDLEVWEVEQGGRVRLMTLQELERLEKERPKEVRRIQLVSPKGKLLSLTAKEAERYGLSRGTVEDLDSLAKALRVEGGIVELENTFADRVLELLTSGPVQALLILVGLVALFMEISTPGFGIPGTIAVICFLTLFGSNALLGTVGSLEIIMLLVGIGLLAVELFILPGFGITGISGLVLIGLALLFSMQDFVFPEFTWQWDILIRNLIVVGSGLLSGIVGVAALILLLPKVRIFDHLALKTMIYGTASGASPLGKQGEILTKSEKGGKAGEGEPHASESIPISEDFQVIPPELVGQEGRALTILRPSGKAKFGDSVYSVETEGEFVPQGAPVRVMYVRGNRIVVKAIS
jgi:membrane-bound serine protease (ClpP class)